MKAVEADTRKLDKLVAELGKDRAIDVGVLGVKYSGEGDSTLAVIGAVHEFGSRERGIEERSFIRMPLARKAGDIEKAGARDLTHKLGNGEIEQILEDMGIAAVGAISEAFETGGFGTWAKNTDRTIARKGSSRPLIDTGELRRSIDYEVI